MRKVLATVIAFVLLGTSAFGDSFQGRWICTMTNAGDNSSTDIVLNVTGKTLKHRWLGYTFGSDYALIFRGKVNPFLVFVELNNTMTETVIVLRATDNTNELHINSTTTADGWGPKGRSFFGYCDRR